MGLNHIKVNMFSWDKPAAQKRFTGNRFSKQGVEHNIAREREREATVQAMDRYVRQSTLSNQEASQMRRAEGARRRNLSLKRAGEQQLEKQYEAQMAKTQRNKNRQKDLALARQLAEVKRLDDKREREIQAICAQDPSLRALNEKIKTAYTSRERKIQIEQQQQQAERIKEQDNILEQQMEIQRQKRINELAKRDEERKKFAEKQRTQIRQQLKERAAHEQLQSIIKYQQEKAQVEKLIQEVHATQQAELKEMERQAGLMKHNMLEGLRIQEQRREAQKRQEEEEDAKINSYKERVAHRNDAADAAKAAKEAAQARIREKIEEEMEQQMAREERMREALLLLGEEEANKRMDEAQRAKREKERLLRQEMMQANEQQKQYKVIVNEEEQAFENDILRRMQAKFDADDAAAKAKADARRKAALEYKDQVANQMAQRDHMYRAALDAEAKHQKTIRDEQEYKAQVVEEARKRILAAHAANLKGYLPKGVLQKESDLEFLNPQHSNNRASTR